MLKKYFLCLFMFTNMLGVRKNHFHDCHYYYDQQSRNDFAGGTILPVLIGTGIIAGTGVYWSMRESNAVKMQRVHDLSAFYAANIYYALAEIKTIKDICAFLEQSVRFKKEVSMFIDLTRASYREMLARYGSWVKPWNWSSEMKNAYENITAVYNTMQLVELMIKYYAFMSVWDQNIDEQALQAKVKAICKGTSSYPMIACANQLNNDLYFLKTTNFKVISEIVMIDMLERLQEMVLSSNAYVEEKRLHEEMLIKERQACAAETQARAAQKQAEAQIAQVYAKNERNRIEQEKLNEQRRR